MEHVALSHHSSASLSYVPFNSTSATQCSSPENTHEQGRTRARRQYWTWQVVRVCLSLFLATKEDGRANSTFLCFDFFCNIWSDLLFEVPVASCGSLYAHGSFSNQHFHRPRRESCKRSEECVYSLYFALSVWHVHSVPELLSNISDTKNANSSQLPSWRQGFCWPSRILFSCQALASVMEALLRLLHTELSWTGLSFSLPNSDSIKTRKTAS